MPPKGRAKKQTAPQEHADEQPASDLLDILLSGGSFLTQIHDAIDNAQAEPHRVVADLVNLIVSSCGVEGNVEAWQVKDEPKNILVEVGDRVPAHATERYPLISKDKKWASFNVGFPKFWYQLTKALDRGGALYEGDFLDILLRWLGGLCSSKVRSFRHQALVAVYSIIDALARIGAQLTELVGKLTSGGGKKGKKKEASQQDDDVRVKLETVKDLIETAYDVSCLSRSRDILPELRVLTLDAQAAWSEHFPAHFVVDNKTKTIGWALYDKEESVRVAALKALEAIYCLPNIFSRMKAFTARFKQRIAEMTLDVSTSVSVQALEIVGILIAHEERQKDHIFTGEIQDGFLEFVYDERQSIRQAAGSVFHLVIDTRVRGVLPNKAPDSKDFREKRIDLIVEWLNEDHIQRNEKAADGVVEALTVVEAANAPSTTIFAAFRRLVDIAIDDSPRDLLDTPNRSNETIIRSALSLLLSIVRKATNNLDLKLQLKDDQLQAVKKAKRNKADACWRGDSEQSILSQLTEYLPKLLPEMLARTKMDAKAVEMLVTTIVMLDPALWTAGGGSREEHLHKILDLLVTLYTSTVDDDALAAIASAVRHLAQADYGLKEHGEQAWERLRKDLLKAVKQKSAATKPQLWARIAIAAEAGLDFADANKDVLWDVLLGYLGNEDIAGHACAPDIIRAAVSVLEMRVYKKARMADAPEYIDLAEDYAALGGPLLKMLDSTVEPKAPLPLRELAFRGLSLIWAVACPPSEGLLPTPNEDAQLDYISTFDDLVPDFIKPVERSPLEHARVQVLNEKWCSALLIKWPFLHLKGQEIVKALHGYLGEKAWMQEAQAIMLAHHRYLKVSEDDVDYAEKVLTQLCVKLSQQHLGRPNKDAVMSLLDVLEGYASNEADNHFVLYAACPFVRYLKIQDAKALLQKIRAREYDTTDNKALAVNHFTQALLKRAGEAPGDEDGKDAPVPKRVIKGSRHVATTNATNAPSTTKKARTSKGLARGLVFDDEDEDEVAATTATASKKSSPSKGSKVVKASPKKKAKDAASSVAASQYTSPSGKKRVRLSQADVSMTFDEALSPAGTSRVDTEFDEPAPKRTKRMSQKTAATEENDVEESQEMSVSQSRKGGRSTGTQSTQKTSQVSKKSSPKGKGRQSQSQSQKLELTARSMTFDEDDEDEEGEEVNFVFGSEVGSQSQSSVAVSSRSLKRKANHDSREEELFAASQVSSEAPPKRARISQTKPIRQGGR